jgi:hypothetical protein
MAVKVFISYSTTDKIIARKVKDILNEYSIEGFLAHEDINVSQEWKDRIIQELSESNVLVPLLSESYKKSDWAPQEIGMAFARGNDIVFIPLLLDTTIPFGFISHIQGKRLSGGEINSDLLIEPLTNRFPHELIPLLIKRMALAISYRNAEALMLPLRYHFQTFNDDEINAFITAAIENGQIWNAGECRSNYLPEFIETHRSSIDQQKLEVLEYQITEQEWHPSRKKRGHLRGNQTDGSL